MHNYSQQALRMIERWLFSQSLAAAEEVWQAAAVGQHNQSVNQAAEVSLADKCNNVWALSVY